MEAAAWAWIEAVLVEPLRGPSLQVKLQDGVALCNLMNKLQPGICPEPSASTAPFQQMENVAEYLEACRQLGVAESDLFAGTDLIYNRHA